MSLPSNCRSAYVFAVLACCIVPTVASAQTPPAVPTRDVQVMLIRNSLTALNHAAISENFSVLFDLGSDNFRQRHRPADLAKSFQSLRANNIDLSPILIHDPQLLQAPVVNRNGQLRLVGICPTKPLAVQFNLVLQYGPRGWGIDDIGLSLVNQSPVAPVSYEQPVAPRSNGQYQPTISNAYPIHQPRQSAPAGSGRLMFFHPPR